MGFAGCRPCDLQLSVVRDGVILRGQKPCCYHWSIWGGNLRWSELYFVSVSEIPGGVFFGEIGQSVIKLLPVEFGLVRSSCDVRRLALCEAFHRANTGILDPALMLEL